MTKKGTSKLNSFFWTRSLKGFYHVFKITLEIFLGTCVSKILLNNCSWSRINTYFKHQRLNFTICIF